LTCIILVNRVFREPPVNFAFLPSQNCPPLRSPIRQMLATRSQPSPFYLVLLQTTSCFFYVVDPVTWMLPKLPCFSPPQESLNQRSFAPLLIVPLSYECIYSLFFRNSYFSLGHTVLFAIQLWRESLPLFRIVPSLHLGGLVSNPQVLSSRFGYTGPPLVGHHYLFFFC